MKPIEEIRKGDWVWSVAPETGDPELKQVEDVFVNETDEIVHVRYGDTEIDATPNHPFYTPDRGWVSAVNLRAGDRLQLVNGEYVTVEQVQHEILESPVKVYNFRVADNHTYYVGQDNAVLVHNANCGGVKPLRAKTRSNFRENLHRLTNKIVDGAEAHHVLPFKFRERFRKSGINVNDPIYGAWVDKVKHSKFSGAYNKEWKAFFDKYDALKRLPTQDEVLRNARAMAHKHGFESELNF